MAAASLSSSETRPAGMAGGAAFSLSALVEELAGQTSARAAEKGLAFRRFIAAETPAMVSGDPGPPRRVLESLLGNAVQFTAAGEVRLDVRPDDAAEGGLPEAGRLLRFTVIDTGIGIEQDARAAVLEGPSLAVCRRLAREMGGDLDFHSLPGEGTSFWFTACFAPAPAGEAPGAAPPAASARPLRILIAEDNPVNQLVLAEQLRSLGHTSLTVTNGREALEAIKGTEWDAILLDCQMPVMDGYETVAAIRRLEDAGAAGIGRVGRLWAVAVTANALDGQREACIRAGMDDFLSKPFHIRQLEEVIARIPRSTEDAAPAVDAGRLADLAKATAVNGDNLLHKMIALFTESGREMLDQMDAALSAGDFPAAALTAHKLAGGCMYFGAKDLYALCLEAQRLGRLGDHASLRAIVPRIRAEYLRVEDALRQTSSSS